MSAKAKKPRACHVLEQSEGRSSYWRFNITSLGAATLGQELIGLPADPLPEKQFAKNWGTVWQPCLNLAWLPAGRVFLKVAEFPECDPAELRAMVELQLEKLSPLPLNQVVWTYEPLPASATAIGMQTVVVVIAARQEVEKYLGALEQRRFLADRLELPALHQLRAVRRDGDGVWFFPRGDEHSATVLMAWWSGGSLRNLTVANLSAPEQREAELADQIARVTWAGELEGWLTGEPEFHLVANPELAAKWRPLLETIAGHTVSIDEPIAPSALAALAAQNAAKGATRANLLPAAQAEKYRQLFVDHLWMRSLATVILLYLFGILLYFGALETLKYQRDSLEAEIGGLANSYTNALISKARVQVLSEQVALKFAALESLKASARELPQGLTLTDFTFSRGRRVTLRGSASAADVSQIGDYSGKLGKVELEGRPLFNQVAAPTIGTGPGGTMTWNFTAELNSPEIQ